VGWEDPAGRISLAIRAAAPATLAALAAREPDPALPGWSDGWRAADAAVRSTAAAVWDAFPFPNEPGVAAAVAEGIPDGSVLWVASSMPIRDVDLAFECTSRRVDIRGNRGANGIDGFLSTGLGSAAVGGPTVLLAGDLSVIHDLGALVTAARLHLAATIVAVNNDGGGIFHLLPQAAGDADRFERLFGTPHGRSLVDAALGLGVPAERITDRAALVAAVGEPAEGPRLVEIVTDRHDNAAVHRAIRDSAAAAIAAVGSDPPG
jgi:2-succinyl-5-enolpyruvyl-6-hydroxy-3-cyclohexene-1-carboxylate synthase